MHRGKEAQDALLRARGLLEDDPTRNAALMGQINALLSRRALSEQERASMWNPRWWARGDRAELAPAAGRYGDGGSPAGGGYETPPPPSGEGTVIFGMDDAEEPGMERVPLMPGMGKDGAFDSRFQGPDAGAELRSGARTPRPVV